MKYSPVANALKLIGGKWKIMILDSLLSKHMRFGELKRALEPITEQMLTKQLRELEKHNIIERNDHRTVPPKVEYYLTDFGKSFSPIILQLQELGKKHKKKIVSVTAEE